MSPLYLSLVLIGTVITLLSMFTNSTTNMSGNIIGYLLFIIATILIIFKNPYIIIACIIILQNIIYSLYLIINYYNKTFDLPLEYKKYNIISFVLIVLQLGLYINVNEPINKIYIFLSSLIGTINIGVLMYYGYILANFTTDG